MVLVMYLAGLFVYLVVGIGSVIVWLRDYEFGSDALLVGMVFCHSVGSELVLKFFDTGVDVDGDGVGIFDVLVNEVVEEGVGVGDGLLWFIWWWFEGV